MATTKLVASVLAAAAGVIAVCVGCGEPPPVDMSLLTGDPCEPPCWQGLTPGVSTEEEVDEVLRESEYVDSLSVDQDRYNGGVAIRWQRKGQTGAENMFDVQNGTLEMMRMYLDADVTLGQLLDKYGPPDKFQAGRSVHPEPVYVNVDVFYRDLGMWVNMRLSADGGELTQDTRLIEVWYFEPADLEEVLVTFAWRKGMPLEDNESRILEQWLEGWHEWKGYGPVQLTYQFGQE